MNDHRLKFGAPRRYWPAHLHPAVRLLVDRAAWYRQMGRAG